MYNLREIGSLDGITMIEMNNTAVGYFPNHVSQLGVYPPITPEKPQEQWPPVPVVEEQPYSEKSS